MLFYEIILVTGKNYSLCISKHLTEQGTKQTIT
jgi:hypothetical protein